MFLSLTLADSVYAELFIPPNEYHKYYFSLPGFSFFRNCSNVFRLIYRRSYPFRILLLFCATDAEVSFYADPVVFHDHLPFSDFVFFLVIPQLRFDTSGSRHLQKLISGFSFLFSRYVSFNLIV